MFSLILMQGYDSDTAIEILGENRLGDLSLKIGFEGKKFNPSDDGEGDSSPELLIIEGYAEKGRYWRLREAFSSSLPVMR